MPEVSPKAQAAATRMKATIADTLMSANQNSNSPYERAEIRFTPVMIAISPTPISHAGNAIHCCSNCAPAMASTGTTTIQKYQYIQPTTNPAQSPRPVRAKSLKVRTCGSATAISPSMRMTSSTRMPAIR